MTAQGHPKTIFWRAIEHGNLILAEGMARELGRAKRYDGGGKISLESARAFSSPPSLRTQNARSPSVGSGGGFSRACAPASWWSARSSPPGARR